MFFKQNLKSLFKLKLIISILSLVTLVIFFQNCSDQFQTFNSEVLGPNPVQAGGSSVGSGSGMPAGGGGTINVNMNQACAQGQTFYISPNGNDLNTGTTAELPFKTFNHSFSMMSAGDQLYLLDGTYSLALGTGVINWQGANSQQAPSGVSKSKMTCIRALHPGNVMILGGLFVGRSFRKDSFIYYEGVTFKTGDAIVGGGGSLYNSDYIYIKNCGFESSTNSGGGILGSGTNDGNWSNTNLLFEDIWVWGHERIGLIIYRSDHVVVRRALIRNDGCSSHSNECGSNTGNSMVGTTIYNSHHVLFENVISADNILGPGGYSGASDIQTAWHDNFIYPFGANQWLGVMSINSEYAGMYPEIDGNIGANYQPFFSYKDIVVVNARDGGVSGQSQLSLAGTSITLENMTVINSNSLGDSVRIGPQYSGMISSYLRNIISIGIGRFGINSAIAPEYVVVNGQWSGGSYNQTNCVSGSACLTTDPLSDGSLKYITRIEASSPLSKTGYGGKDIGANVQYAYGVDGAFFGDMNYNTETSQSLWPWPNQNRIQSEMCIQSNVNRGFCSKKNISYYVWEYLGNPCPLGLCE